MSAIKPANVSRPTIDLATVYETLALIRDDLAGTPELATIERSLTRVLTEIEAVEPRRPTLPVRLPEQLTARFVPWSPRV